MERRSLCDLERVDSLKQKIKYLHNLIVCRRRRWEARGNVKCIFKWSRKRDEKTGYEHSLGGNKREAQRARASTANKRWSTLRLRITTIFSGSNLRVWGNCENFNETLFSSSFRCFVSVRVVAVKPQMLLLRFMHNGRRVSDREEGAGEGRVHLIIKKKQKEFQMMWLRAPSWTEFAWWWWWKWNDAAKSLSSEIDTSDDEFFVLVARLASEVSSLLVFIF